MYSTEGASLRRESKLTFMCAGWNKVLFATVSTVVSYSEGGGLRTTNPHFVLAPIQQLFVEHYLVILTVFIHMHFISFAFSRLVATFIYTMAINIQQESLLF